MSASLSSPWKIIHKSTFKYHNNYKIKIHMKHLKIRITYQQNRCTLLGQNIVIFWIHGRGLIGLSSFQLVNSSRAGSLKQRARLPAQLMKKLKRAESSRAERATSRASWRTACILSEPSQEPFRRGGYCRIELLRAPYLAISVAPPLDVDTKFYKSNQAQNQLTPRKTRSSLFLGQGIR